MVIYKVSQFTTCVVSVNNIITFPRISGTHLKEFRNFFCCKPNLFSNENVSVKKVKTRHVSSPKVVNKAVYRYPVMSTLQEF